MDELNVPDKPDLRCSEHGNVCEVMHSVYNRLVALESRIVVLEERIAMEVGDAEDRRASEQ